MTLKTPTEQDKEVVFEIHQNGKLIITAFLCDNYIHSFSDDESPSVGSDNEIKMKYPYPSLDLLYECM